MREGVTESFLAGSSDPADVHPSELGGVYEEKALKGGLRDARGAGSRTLP